MKKEIIFGALALSLMVTSCATIFSGTKQNVRFSSNPPSALVFIDDVEAGKTPFEMKLNRKPDLHKSSTVGVLGIFLLVV